MNNLAHFEGRGKHEPLNEQQGVGERQAWNKNPEQCFVDQLAVRAKVLQPFALHFGRVVPRGCPLVSPLLFYIVIEMMALAVRADSNICSVKIGNIEHKLVFYVGDVFLLRCPAQSSTSLNMRLGLFAQASGYKINLFCCVLRYLMMKSSKSQSVAKLNESKKIQGILESVINHIISY